MTIGQIQKNSQFARSVVEKPGVRGRAVSVF
jgi:hypothetical protein